MATTAPNKPDAAKIIHLCIVSSDNVIPLSEVKIAKRKLPTLGLSLSTSLYLEEVLVIHLPA